MTDMHTDLNLLTVLDALLEAGSVSGAAERLHLTQPAMSRALGRVRRATGDQILVRSGRAMVPTPRALALHAQVHDMVQRAEAILAPAADIDLASVQRTFAIRANDAITTAISAEVVGRVTVNAPGVRLRFVGEAASDIDSGDLRDGHLDLLVSAQTPAQADVCSRAVGADRLVAVTRVEYPLSALTLDDYASARHLTVSRRGRLRDPIDDVLEGHGLRRHVAAAVPTIHAALRMAALGDFVVVVPERMSARTVVELGLRTTTLPFDVEPVPVVTAWHRRYHDDQVHGWLRRQVTGVIAAELAPASTAD